MLEIVDTAGQEEYTALCDLWIRSGEAFMLVYSITSRSSFGRIRRFHDQVKRLKEQDSSPFMCLVGNKYDMTFEREVSTQEGFTLAKELGCDFYEVSSKNCVNVEAPFYDLVRAIRKHQSNGPEQTRILEDEVALSQSQRRSQPQHPKSSSFSSLTKLFRPLKSTNNAHSLDVPQQMSLNRLLVRTAQQDKRKTAKRLLSVGADPNGDSGADGTPLYAAAALGHSKMVALLLDSGAAINAKSIRGSTPLVIAAAEGHAAVVETLLARGASTDVRSDIHGTPLIVAVFRCHLTVLKALLLHGAKVNEKGGQYDTALHTIAAVGNVGIAKVLLEAGADVTLRDRDDCTALQVAAAVGHAEIVRLLLLRGAHWLIDDTRGKYGSALKAANDRSRFDVMKVLLEAGATERTLNLQTLPAISPPDVKVSNEQSSTTMNLNNGNAAATKQDRILAGNVENASSVTKGDNQDQVKYDSRQDSDKNWPLVTIHGDPDSDTQQLNPEVPISIKEDSASSSVDHYDYSSTQTIPWKFIARLGQGNGSTIDEVEATDGKISQTRYARKSFLVPPHSRRKLLTVIHNEINILKCLRHIHTAKIYSTYSTEREFSIIMGPVAEMTLGEYLAYNTHPTGDSPIYSWFGCLATAIDYLHERKIKHQDVKPANILVRDGQVIITDFGISKDVLHESTTGSIGPSAKTLMYCAPEVANLENDSRRGRVADIFSLGCVFLEMLTTLLWTHGCSVQKLHDQLVINERKVYSASLTKLLQWILMLYAFANMGNNSSSTTNTRSAKTSCIQALEWCLAMLLVDPQSRITASELKGAIHGYQAWRVKKAGSQDPMAVAPSWVGSCCTSVIKGNAEDVEELKVMHSWPELTLDATTLGYTPWDWEDIKSRMIFRENVV